MEKVEEAYNYGRMVDSTSDLRSGATMDPGHAATPALMNYFHTLRTPDLNVDTRIKALEDAEQAIRRNGLPELVRGVYSSGQFDPAGLASLARELTLNLPAEEMLAQRVRAALSFGSAAMSIPENHQAAELVNRYRQALADTAFDEGSVNLLRDQVVQALVPPDNTQAGRPYHAAPHPPSYAAPPPPPSYATQGYGGGYADPPSSPHPADSQGYGGGYANPPPASPPPARPQPADSHSELREELKATQREIMRGVQRELEDQRHHIHDDLSEARGLIRDDVNAVRRDIDAVRDDIAADDD
jgi:hypothetical protein